MRGYKQSRIILSLLMGLILLAFCLPVCAFAETSEFSDGDEKGISLLTSVPPSIISGAGAVYEKGGATGLTFKTDDAKDNLLRVLVDGKVVSPGNYSVSGEPLAITLLPVQHEIDVFSDRISIVNPGSFANEFEPIDFVSRDIHSFLRNESEYE